MATSVFSHTQTQIHTPTKFQNQRRERSIEDDLKEAYDDYDAQYQHEHQYQFQYQQRNQFQYHDHQNQEYNHTLNHLPSIPSNEELPGLIAHSQSRQVESEDSSPWSTAFPSPASEEKDEIDPSNHVNANREGGGDTGLRSKAESKSNLKQVSSSPKGATAAEQESVDGNGALDVKEANGWIAELDEKLDLVRIEEHQSQQQQQQHDYHQEESRSRAQSQRQRRQRSLSTHSHPHGHGHTRPQYISAAAPVPINHDIAALQLVGGHKDKGTSQTRSRTRTLSQAGTRGQSQVQARAGSRARSIDRFGAPAGGNAVANTYIHGSGSGRPFSPVVRGRGRTGRLPSNSIPASFQLQPHSLSDVQDVEKEKEKEKEEHTAKVVVKEVGLELNSDGDRNTNKGDKDVIASLVVASPSARRQRKESKSRGRGGSSYNSIYQHFHPAVGSSGSGSAHSHSPLHAHLHSHSPLHSHSHSHSTSPCPPQHPTQKLDPYTATLPTLTQALQAYTLTSVQIIETYLAQIAEHNPTLRALCWVRDRESLLNEARMCDQFRARGIVDWERTPLWGVPIVVK